MSKLTSTFATMIRQATVGFRYFCARCNKETHWHLVGEDDRNEYYACDGCGDRKSWAVR